MDCSAYMEAMSAMADGERPKIEPRIVDAHVSVCQTCQSYRRALDTSSPGMLLAQRHGSRLALAAERAASWPTTRVLLAIVAVQLVVLSSRDLLWPSTDFDGLHDVRHLAAFTLAYGMLLIAVVMRPTRAAAALPAATVLAGALAITAVVDLAAGRIPLAGEVLHIPEVLSVVLIRILAPTDRPFGMIRLMGKPAHRSRFRGRKAC